MKSFVTDYNYSKQQVLLKIGLQIPYVFIHNSIYFIVKYY